MTQREAISKAKELLGQRLGDFDWLNSVGIARVESRVGIVVSVRAGSRAAAERALSTLDLEVPVLIREIRRPRRR